MYGWYAPDPRMRANVGIRRRLAPLLDNSPRRDRARPRPAALAAGLARACTTATRSAWATTSGCTTATPSRTPMQWTPDRNAGFSTADPGKLYLPVVQSLVYHYNHVNVEAQLAQPRSLLHWVRGMLHVRKAHPAFGLGDFEVCPSDNEAVLAFVRRHSRPATAHRRRRPSCASTTCRRGRRPRRSGCPSEFEGASSSTSSAAGLPQGRRRRHAHADARLARLLLAAPATRVRLVAEIHQATLTPTKLELLPGVDGAAALVCRQGPGPEAAPALVVATRRPRGPGGHRDAPRRGRVRSRAGRLPGAAHLSRRAARERPPRPDRHDGAQRPRQALGLRRPARPGLRRPAARAHPRARCGAGGLGVAHRRAGRRRRPAPVVDGRDDAARVRAC